MGLFGGDLNETFAKHGRKFISLLTSILSSPEERRKNLSGNSQGDNFCTKHDSVRYKSIAR